MVTLMVGIVTCAEDHGLGRNIISVIRSFETVAPFLVSVYQKSLLSRTPRAPTHQVSLLLAINTTFSRIPQLCIVLHSSESDDRKPASAGDPHWRTPSRCPSRFLYAALTLYTQQTVLDTTTGLWY